MKVKIVSSKEHTYWYKDDIGKVFNVIEYSPTKYAVDSKFHEKPFDYMTHCIDKCDCVKLIDVQPFHIEKGLFEI